MNQHPKLEVCAANLRSVRAARQGGAVRVELCSALDRDGLTPALQSIHATMREQIDVNILIRPREGNFVYSADEVHRMDQSIRRVAAAGVHGVVFGALTEAGDVDVKTCSRLMQTAQRYGLSTTFHRAFDVCRSPKEALEVIIQLGFDHLLTSGQAPTAEAGIPLLRELVEQADGRIIVMPGAGVSPQNVARILRETGATEIHGSLRLSDTTSLRLVKATCRAIEEV